MEATHEGQPFLLSDMEEGPERLVKQFVVGHPQNLPIERDVAVNELTAQLEAVCAEQGWMPEDDPKIYQLDSAGTRWALYAVCRKMGHRVNPNAHLDQPMLTPADQLRKAAK